MSNPFFVGMNQGPMPPPPPGPMPPHSQGPGSMMTQGPPGGMMTHGPGGPPMPPPPGPPHMAGLMDPSMNNAPLQFNPNKGKPPMPIPGQMGMPENGDNGGASNTDMNPITSSAASVSSPTGGGQDMGQGGGPPMSGMMGPGMMGPGMMGPGYNPNMMMMPMPQFGQFGYMGPMGPGGMGGDMGPPKELIKLKSAVLYPPPPNAPPPSARERPPGCRTIFVGGLPENMTEDILREIFDNCGPITSIRLSKKNFSHVRFENEESIDRALYISGYRIKMDNKDDKPNTGRVHVDYAQARDDLYEWECKQRSQAREHRHRQRIEQERLRPPSPPPIIHFSDHEASQLAEKLKADDTFMKGSQVLVTWLDRGDCSRRTSNTFYSLVQSVNSHVRRLMNEKSQHDTELDQMKLKFRQRLEGILRQFEQIEKVFSVASKQKSWDHFSKAQRKNLEVWRKQAEEIKRLNQEEFLKDREEAEMEMSDSEDGEAAPPKRVKRQEDMVSLQDQAMRWAALKSNSTAYAHTVINLVDDVTAASSVKEENDSLKCQLEAYKNEVDLIKQEHKNSMEDKDKQIKSLQQALQGMQQQLISTKQKMSKDEKELSRLKVKVSSMSDSPETTEVITLDGDKVSEKSEDGPNIITITSGVSEREARLVGLMCTFLHVHPFGASVDYLWSYLQRLDIVIRSSEIEDLLEKLPMVFRQDLFGVGATLEKRWKFVGFENKNNGSTT